MTANEQIQWLIDTKAIEQLLARYARAADWLDIDALKACFEDGAVVRFGVHEMAADRFCDFWGEMGGGFKARHHLFGVPVISLNGADEAYVEVTCFAAGTKADASGARLRDFLEANRYLFKARRANARWKLAESRIFITWSQGGPTPTAIEAGGLLDHEVTMANPAFVEIA